MFVLGIIVFIKFTGKLHQGELNTFDEGVTDFFFALRSPGFTSIMTFITDMGNVIAYLIWLPVIFFVLYFAKREWSRSIEAMVILLSSFLLNIALKAYYGRVRPDPQYWLVDLTEGSLSYPSGHSMTAMAFYGFIIYLVHRYPINTALTTLLSLLFGALILMIGITRIYLGAHFPTDVVAGFVAGFAWLVLSISTLRYFRYRRDNKAKL